MTRTIFGLMGMETPRHEIIKEHKLGRFGKPEEIAAVITWLLSDDAAAVTGEAVNASAGQTMV